MIYGIGTDLIDIARMAEAYQRHGVRFLNRLLAKDEQAEFASATDPARFLAKRWAAKEAFAKAVGTGIRPPLSLAGITITHDALGRPGLAFDAAIAAYLDERNIRHAHLSLSDERSAVVAFVVLERV